MSLDRKELTHKGLKYTVFPLFLKRPLTKTAMSAALHFYLQKCTWFFIPLHDSHLVPGTLKNARSKQSCTDKSKVA